jgi:hypothetical protein
MNIEDVKKMTLEEKCFRIAELCGLTRHDESYPYKDSPNGMCKRIVWRNGNGEAKFIGDEGIPDYLNDLNAMAEVRKILKQDYTAQDFQQARFIRNLENIVFLAPGFNNWSWALVNSTAEQQADAFLATMLP